MPPGRLSGFGEGGDLTQLMDIEAVAGSFILTFVFHAVLVIIFGGIINLYKIWSLYYILLLHSYVQFSIFDNFTLELLRLLSLFFFYQILSSYLMLKRVS